MAQFPEYPGENAQVPRQPITVTPPEDDPSESAADRFLDQQWRDVAENGLASTHPLSVNRDSSHVTDDPYTP